MSHTAKNFDLKAIARRVKQLQNSKGLTNVDMARLLNVSESQYAKLLRGECMFSQDKLLILHNELGVSVDYILTGEMPLDKNDVINETGYSIYLEALGEYVMKLPDEKRRDKIKEMATTFHEVLIKGL
jgi:transcriptional regulator with XRE-family HTH domain